MFLDTSAIIEILLDNPQSDALIKRLAASGSPRSTGPSVVYEASVVLSTRRNLSISTSERVVRSLLREMNVAILPISDHTASLALDAFSRYGKGRHPAKLNFGDCFSYAGAKEADSELLYVGDDFTMTDLA